MIFTTTTVALRNYKLLSLSGGLLDHNDLGVRVAHGVYAGQGTWRRGILHIVKSFLFMGTKFCCVMMMDMSMNTLICGFQFILNITNLKCINILWGS